MTLTSPRVSGPRPRGRRALLLSALFVAVTAGACTTDLESEGGCPLLCPGEQVDVRQVDLEAIVLDTTLQGFPLRGEEGALLVAREGDGLDTRAVYRFDAVPRRYAPLGQDSTDITELFEAYLRIRIDTATAEIAPGTILQVFDVSGPGADDNVGLLVSRFTPDRLLGSIEVPLAPTADTLRIPLDEDRILALILADGRVRVGVRAVTGGGRSLLRLASIDAALGIDPSESETEGPIISTPTSLTPTNDETIRRSLTSFVLIGAGSGALPSATISAGGLPARRTLLRFAIPASILDSTTVVRATLVLTQRPVPGTVLADSVTLTPVPVKASDAVVDILQAILLSGNPTAAGGEAQVVAPIRLSPADSGQKLIEIASLVDFWRTGTPNRPQRALVLRVSEEGLRPGELRFFSVEADPSLRPRLRITFIPRLNLGIP